MWLDRLVKLLTIGSSKVLVGLEILLIMAKIIGCLMSFTKNPIIYIMRRRV